MPANNERTIAGLGFVFDQATGALVSIASVVADPLPNGMGIIERDSDIDRNAERWDTAARKIMPFTNTEKATELRKQAAQLNAAADKISR